MALLIDNWSYFTPISGVISPISGDATTQMVGFPPSKPRLSALVTEVREQKVVPGGLAPRTLMPVAWSVENNFVF